MKENTQKLALKLEELHVQSFVTALSADEKSRIHGGDTQCPDANTGSGASVTYCISGICNCPSGTGFPPLC